VNRVSAASAATKKLRGARLRANRAKVWNTMSIVERDRQTVNDPIVSHTEVEGCALKPSPYADPAIVFLARASARDRLVASGDMTLDEAIDGLVLAFEQLRPCACHREMLERMMTPEPRQKQGKP
jgi:hypothetical protein